MNLTLLFSLLVSYGKAHILMKKPPSDKYMGRTDIPEAQKDPDLKNPMTKDRINNPCGSVQKIVSSGNYTAGSNVDVELDGIATHEGGQCQFGYTYDRQAFAVTHI
ncbi:hypothetical protein DSO57_1000318 [Entomophthora muscae]|uniref:Uncharacterized protein n=1 Tax=Entomophthora muscae TaxID=34485 RepID=A0ACC2TK32_9FUNG|nr:hypothetical protein DSO57_1000318 [Entomophthora muscae]